MKIALLLFFILYSQYCFYGQETEWKKTIDSLYREDQFYIGFTYNVLINKPKDIDNSRFSGGFHMGFLRDMPVNQRRNIALAAGLGYAFNKYGQNMLIENQPNGMPQYFVLNNESEFKTNRFVTHEIELPLELRWRTSTPEYYRFWRIYAGVKAGYIFHFKSTYKDSNSTINSTNLDHIERLRYTVFLNFGYNTFNFQIQYQLNSLFTKDAILEGNQIEISTFKMGLLFYIL